MKIIREIEATTRSKQVVLISHCDTLHILQTIFSGQKPGSHRLLSLMTPGFVKEVKFSSGPGGMGDDLDDGEVQEAEQVMMRPFWPILFLQVHSIRSFTKRQDGLNPFKQIRVEYVLISVCPMPLFPLPGKKYSSLPHIVGGAREA
jgi:hypothetical protein